MKEIKRRKKGRNRERSGAKPLREAEKDQARFLFRE